jgi:APA family basic amino acid/polyamine antiporter
MTTELRRDIRKWDLVALVLNIVIGAGIFGLPARAFALAGVYSLAAYVVCAVPIFLIVLCFAEVGSRFKETGGLYVYARAAFGPLVGFEIGWLVWLTRITAFGGLCNLFVDYLAYFIPAVASGVGRSVAITVVLSALAAVNVAGVRVASMVGNVFTVGKLLPLLVLIVLGFFFINAGNYSAGGVPTYSSFSSAVLLLVFAFTGFEAASIPAGESRDPRRHLPFALVAGTSIAVVLYVALQAICIGTVPNLATSQRPLADAGGYIMGSAGAAFISFGALISIAGTMNGNMLTGPRLLFAMAENGQLPRIASLTHARFKTPHIAILFSAALMLLLTLSGTFISLATLSTVIRLTTYASTCAAVQVLRRRREEPGLFVMPFGQVISTAALLLIVWLLSSSAWSEVIKTLLAALAGLLLYAAYAARQRQRRYEVVRN